MDFNALSAWAGVLAVFAAIVGLIIQVRQAAFNSSLDSLWHLEETFATADMLQGRSLAAKFLLDRSADETQEVAAVDGVLDFFDLLGYLVRKHAITKEAAWINFSDWVINYWFASRSYIASQRKHNKLYWANYDWLTPVMLRIEATKQGRSTTDVTPSERDWRHFLATEYDSRAIDALPNETTLRSG